MSCTTQRRTYSSIHISSTISALHFMPTTSPASLLPSHQRSSARPRSVLPTLDADGNEIGGIHNPLQQAPLGTYVGWNNVVSGFRRGQFCPLTGGYIPFAATEAERVAAPIRALRSKSA